MNFCHNIKNIFFNTLWKKIKTPLFRDYNKFYSNPFLWLKIKNRRDMFKEQWQIVKDYLTQKSDLEMVIDATQNNYLAKIDIKNFGPVNVNWKSIVKKFVPVCIINLSRKILCR